MSTADVEREPPSRRRWTSDDEAVRTIGGRPLPSVTRESYDGSSDGEVTLEPRADWEAEEREVLGELDSLMHDLANPASPRAPEVEPTPEFLPVPSAPLLPEESDEELRGSSSPYLEERLATAQDVACELSEEFERMERRGSELRVAVRTLETELHRASAEVSFLRENGRREGPPPLSMASAAATASGRPAPPEGPDEPDDPEGSAGNEGPSPPAYDQFTVARYNDTVGDLVARRRSLAAKTLILAVAISVALLTVTLIWREPVPSPWILAALPVVWLVPVPFFIASFRGTQRVLARHPLGLPEAP
jgi:hypothetical protein